MHSTTIRDLPRGMRSTFLVTCLAISSALWTLPGIAATASCSANAGHKLSIAIGSTGFLYLPMFVAVNAGFAKDAGVAVQVQNLGGQSNSAFISGASDLAHGGFSNVANLRKAGRDVVAVGGTVDQIAQFLVLKSDVASKAGISENLAFQDKIKRMKGMRVGLFTPGTGADNYMRAMAKDAGVNPDAELKMIYLQDEKTISAAFQTGQIDAFIASAPLATIAVEKQGGMIAVSLPKGEYPRVRNSLQMVYLARNDWLQRAQNRAAVGCLLVATQRALDLIASDPAAALRIAKPSFGNIDQATYELGFKQNQAAYARSVRMAQASVDVALDFENYLTGKPLGGPPEKHYDNTLATEYVAK